MFLNFENSKRWNIMDKGRHPKSTFAEKFSIFRLLNSCFSRRFHESAETVHVAGEISQADFDFCPDNADRPDNQIACHPGLRPKNMFQSRPWSLPLSFALLFPVGKPGIFESFVLNVRTVFQLVKFVALHFGSA